MGGAAWILFFSGCLLGLGGFLGGAKLGVEIDFLGEERILGSAGADAVAFQTDIAVSAGLGGAAADRVDLVLAVGYDLDVAVAFGVHGHQAHAAVFLGRGFLAHARLGRAGRLGDAHVAVGSYLEGDVAAVGDETDITIAARLGRRRFRPGLGCGFRPRFGSDQPAAAAALDLTAAARRIGNDLLADFDLIAFTAEAEVEDARIAASRLAHRGIRFFAGWLLGGFAQLQIRVAADAFAAGQFFNVLCTEAPGAAVGEGADLAFLGHVAQVFRTRAEDLRCLFKRVIALYHGAVLFAPRAGSIRKSANRATKDGNVRTERDYT